ncbi:unnamed protein product [Vitrella brassicaformis CCMP3155]|uniref:Ribosomal RNA small subunit methyltransferase NEP1 n=1 Tax=Vitrella brassicaformis (strain CCMP3155) TaxID=1169540 RepID=A0A0G4G485_VITBC|nr:unnamed protein product [Vitrella brassicaformis CCMP3155]|mmetsp:Transcript_51158/g.128458  ORF Transcript_51158/g.128458 Transcript_51158/m.128458 type:complete len:227 (-) Transcript_51158:134-814(-)|eukprot:CEM23225.1 unnamed protein product [Vitrella brassicaformis CCMP3155]
MEEYVRVPRTLEEKQKGQRIVVLLEKACLETVKLKESHQLLNCDDHQSYLAKNKRDIADIRPDIVHQCLMTLLDSPLNREGMLLIYVHTASNVLIEVSPQLRIPRTFKRFAGLMVELLMKSKIKATDGSATLMRIISNPVTKYLPPGGSKVGLSVDGKLVKLRDWMPKHVNKEIPTTFVIGAVARGDPAKELDYVEDKISISNYGLSASVCCSKVCNEVENLWNIF